MFNNIGFPELVLLGLVGLFVFGPERLPTVIRDAAKTIRTLRAMAQQATDEIRGELGPELAGLSLADMHPKALVKKHLIDPAMLDEEIGDLSSLFKGTKGDILGLKSDLTATRRDVEDTVRVSMAKPSGPTPPVASVSAVPAASGPRFDADAT